jgi:hypothetical protein
VHEGEGFARPFDFIEMRSEFDTIRAVQARREAQENWRQTCIAAIHESDVLRLMCLEIFKCGNCSGCDVRGDQTVRTHQGQALLLVVHDSARYIYVYRHWRGAVRIVIGLRTAAGMLAHPRAANSTSIMVRHNARKCQDTIANACANHQQHN